VQRLTGRALAQRVSWELVIYRTFHDRRPSVLLVDDDLPLQQYLTNELRLAGFLVRQACDGLAALRCAEERVPDVVVLDLDMPRLNGLATLTELHVQPPTSHVPVIVVTGTDWRVPPVAFGVMRKPLTLVPFLSLLWSAVESPAIGRPETVSR
jgi:PleD family two-component response regulator